MKRRLWSEVSIAIALGTTGLLVIVAAQGNPVAVGRSSRQSVGHSVSPLAVSRQPSSYAATVRPFVVKYCLACHSTKLKSGHLDLQRFVSTAQIGKDPKPWQGVIE